MDGKMKNIIKCIKNYKYEIFIFIFTFLSLCFCLNGTFNHDDEVLFYFRGRKLLENIGFWQMIKIAYNAWIARGRFSPMALLESYIVYYIFPEYVYYELFIIIITCIDVMLFGSFVFRLFNEKKTKLVSMLFIGCFFQVYSIYHNSIIGYAALIQCCVFLTLLQCIFFQEYIETNKKIYFVLSIIMQLLAVGFYEFCYFNIVYIFCLCMYKKVKIKQVLKLGIIYCIPLFVVGVYSLYVNVLSTLIGTQIYEGSKVSFDLVVFIKTYIKQIVAALPLSNYLLTKGFAEPLISSSIFMGISIWEILLLIIGIFLIIMICFTKEGSNDEIVIKENRIWIYLLALALWGLPGILPSLSQKYQNELYFGIGHICVFMEYFGAALFIILLYHDIIFVFFKNKKIIYKRIFQIIAITFISFVFMTNLLATKRNVLFLESARKYTKEATTIATRNGLFDNAPEDIEVLILAPMPNDSSEYYTQNAGKRIRIVSQGAIQEKISEAGSSKDIKDVFDNNLCILRYSGTAEDKVVFLGWISDIKTDEDGNLTNIYVDQIDLYYNKGIDSVYYDNDGIEEIIFHSSDHSSLIHNIKVNNLEFYKLGVH